MSSGETLRNAAIGAAVTVLVSFLGVSSVVGGGVAGYLQRESRERGATVGAISGALATIPLALVVAVIVVVVLAGPVFGGGPGATGGLGVVLVLAVVISLFLVWNVVLGAIGGYLGVYVREEYDVPDAGTPTETGDQHAASGPADPRSRDGDEEERSSFGKR